MLILWSCFVVSAQADSYLEALEAESERTNSNTVNPTARVLGDQLSSGLDKATFETLMEDNFSSTYRFYTQLSSEQKEEVYALYQLSPDIKQLRSLITKLYVQ